MSLTPEDYNKQQWFDREHIKSSVEKDSIANIRETRDYFEKASSAADFQSLSSFFSGLPI